jgi:predicted transcriptional regulator
VSCVDYDSVSIFVDSNSSIRDSVDVLVAVVAVASVAHSRVNTSNAGSSCISERSSIYRTIAQSPSA